MAHGICELLWLKILLKELWYDYKDSMRLYCENKVAINITHNPVQHNWTNRIEIDRHFIKEKLCAWLICTPYVKMWERLADILTKGVFSGTLHWALCKLGMWDIFASAWSGVLKKETFDMHFTWFDYFWFHFYFCNKKKVFFHNRQ
jgi:hypothetical protein